MEAAGSVLTNKYAEGYPGKRYYGGCQVVDEVETLAIERAKTLFGAEYVNVQPHSGSQANTAVFAACLKPGDTILGFDLSHGGHLTHGSPVNFSGKLYNPVFYGVEESTGRIDYDKLEAIAVKEQPKLIIAGASAYSRDMDFKRFREVADKVGALLLADISHPAGLIAKGILNDPLPHCHIVTSAVFPGNQGGPLEHVIAAKAIAFGEALTDEFMHYMLQVKKNAAAMAEAFVNRGYHLISGGTDNHMMLIDLRNKDITGKDAENALGKAEITVNKNMVPFDDKSPFVTSGIRVGTPAITSRGLVESDMDAIVALVDEALMNYEDDAKLEAIGHKVNAMMNGKPLFATNVTA